MISQYRINIGKLKIINEYAPTNKTTRTDQQQTEDIYTLLNQLVKYKIENNSRRFQRRNY